MRRRQTGITFLGLLVLIVVLGTWVYAAVRITPMYLNYMKVAGTLEKVRDEFNSNPNTTEQMIRLSLSRHFDIEMVNEDVFTYNDVTIKKRGDAFLVTASYEDTAPFVANISFLATFNKSVEIQAH